MAYNPNLLQLTDVLQQLYRRLGGKVATATEGDTDTVIDTKLEEELGDGNEDDLFNGGTLLVANTTNGAAPIGEYARIADYEAATQSLSLSPALSADVDSGDTVIIAPPDFPLFDMVEVVNDSLKYFDAIPIPDNSLLTNNSQTEYDLPAVAVGRQLLDVEVQTNLDDSNDNRFVPIENFSIVPPALPGGTGLLVIPQLLAGYDIRLIFLGVHPRVDAFDDFISSFLHPDLVHAVVFAHVIQWKNDRDALSGGANDASLKLETKAWSQVDRAFALHPIAIPPRRIQGMPHFNATNSGNLYPPYSQYG